MRGTFSTSKTWVFAEAAARNSSPPVNSVSHLTNTVANPSGITRSAGQGREGRDGLPTANYQPSFRSPPPKAWFSAIDARLIPRPGIPLAPPATTEPSDDAQMDSGRRESASDDRPCSIHKDDVMGW